MQVRVPVRAGTHYPPACNPYLFPLQGLLHYFAASSSPTFIIDAVKDGSGQFLAVRHATITLTISQNGRSPRACSLTRTLRGHLSYLSSSIVSIVSIVHFVCDAPRKNSCCDEEGFREASDSLNGQTYCTRASE
ncbi:uncharacterized protein LOC105284476 isoform X1 [Ooceraea biroi]|uniref:uncharacterized protein LOC105284476 isoform X1 n=1 Tax=Ooceraea biroi TaxID=2015173 RepID=UPI000F07B945|nr:uncharacterized protein LOC105284476 isoform X1 [Ooceraea biroi]